MPVIHRWRGYRFHFFSADGGEPAHVHVEKADKQAKVWLHDITFAYNFGFNASEMSDIIRECRRERTIMIEAWNDYFAN